MSCTVSTRRKLSQPKNEMFSLLMTSRQCHYSLHLNQIYSAYNLKYYLSYGHSVLHYLCQARHSEVPLSAFQNYKMFRLLMTSLERHDRLITIQTLPKAHPKRLSFIFRVYCGLNIFRSASIPSTVSLLRL